jgi:hypothetical protein
MSIAVENSLVLYRALTNWEDSGFADRPTAGNPPCESPERSAPSIVRSDKIAAPRLKRIAASTPIAANESVVYRSKAKN